MGLLDDVKRDPMNVHLYDAHQIAAALIAAERVALMMQEYIEVLFEPDKQLCCDGYHCGCQGATKHQEAEHYAMEALRAYRAAAGAT